MYVSVTGLRLKSLKHLATFWRHAIPSFRQAQTAPGNLFCETKRRGKFQHTLTVWQDRKAMKAYVASGPHLKAMAVFGAIADGKTFGWEAETMPDWAEALARWDAEAKDV